MKVKNHSLSLHGHQPEGLHKAVVLGDQAGIMHLMKVGRSAQLCGVEKLHYVWSILKLSWCYSHLQIMQLQGPAWCSHQPARCQRLFSPDVCCHGWLKACCWNAAQLWCHFTMFLLKVYNL